MANKWVGAFAVVALLSSALYFADSTLTSRSLALNPSAFLAQTAAPSNVAAPAYKLCPQESPTEAYVETSDKSKQFPAKFEAPDTYAFYAGGFSTGNVMKTNLYGKSCSYRNSSGVFVQAECVRPEKCRATAFEDQYGIMHPVSEKTYTDAYGVVRTADKTYDSTGPLGGLSTPEAIAVGGGAVLGGGVVCGLVGVAPCVGGAIVGGGLLVGGAAQAQDDTPKTDQGTAGPSAIVPQQPVTNTPAPQQPVTPVPAEQPTVTQPAPQYTPPIERIQQYTGGQGGGAIPTPQPAPQSYPGPSNAVVSQPQSLSSGYSPSAELGQPAGNFPGGSVLPSYYAPTTLGGQYIPPPYQSAAAKPSGNGITSLFTSLFSGLLGGQQKPAPTSGQSPAGNAGASKNNPSGTITYLIPFPSQYSLSANTDAGRTITALGSQNKAVQVSGTNLPNAPAPETSALFQPMYSPATLGIKDLFAGSDNGESAGLGSVASTLGAPIVAWSGARAVATGVPIDIAGPTDIASLFADFNGGWIPQANTTLFQEDIRLAQAQAAADNVAAQIDTLEEARSAGLCDTACGISLTSLENEFAVQQADIGTLKAAVYRDATVASELPAPAAQASRIVQDYFVNSRNENARAPSAQNLTGASSAQIEPKATQELSGTPAQYAPAPSGGVSAGFREDITPAAPDAGDGETVLVRIVSGIWNVFSSLFSPDTASATSTPPQYCSLLFRLFGGCK